MTTILILNALSSLVAAVGIVVLVARQRRQRQAVMVQPLYVTRRRRD
jgi:hypothetical protein